MKKVLLVGAGLLVVLGVMAAKKGKDQDGTQTVPADIFTLYNNTVVSDSAGYWFLIRDGKLWTPNGQASLDTFFAANPGRYVKLDFPVWTNYADKPEFIGGNF